LIKKLLQRIGGKQKAAPEKSGGESSKPSSKKPQQPAKKKAHNGDANKGGKKASGQTASAGGGQSARNKKHQRESHRKQQPKRAEVKPWDLSQFVVPEEEDKTRFHDLDLPLPLMQGIAELGFRYCSPIQAQSLPRALNGYDVLGKAQTGTGKTAAFLITVITDLLKNPIEDEHYLGEPRALVLAPTRELALQIAKDAEALCRFTNLHTVSLVGGMDYDKQQRQLEKRLVDIVVATPGRLMDFQTRGQIHLDEVEILVIDEADRMLDMGFIPQVRRIVRATPRKTHRQTLLFSATFTQDVLSLSEQWTEDPVTIEIEPDSVATDTVEQHVYMVATEQKYAMLYNLLQDEAAVSVIVFANRRDQTRNLFDHLRAHDFPVGMLSGEVAQNKRVRTLEDFRSGKLKVLVATDVAGRGIHIDGVSHVVNFNLPEDPEDYVHRIGRTGRAGSSGTSVSFACEDDAFLVPDLEAMLGKKIELEHPPEALLVEPPKVKIQRTPRSNDQRGGKGGGGRGGHRGGSSQRSRRH